jgi:hypothetical protein
MGYVGTPFLQQDLTSVKRINRRLRESRETDEALTRKHKYQWMLKVADKHDAEGRPEVAARIRKKAKKFAEAGIKGMKWGQKHGRPWGTLRSGDFSQRQADIDDKRARDSHIQARQGQGWKLVKKGRSPSGAFYHQMRSPDGHITDYTVNEGKVNRTFGESGQEY